MREVTCCKANITVLDGLLSSFIVISAIIPTRFSLGGYTPAYYLPFLAFVLLAISNVRIEFTGIMQNKCAVVGACIIAVVCLVNGDTGNFYSFFFPRVMLLICGYLFVGSRERLDLLINTIVVIFAVLGFFAIVESVLSFNIFDAICGDYVQYEAANAMRFGLARSRSVSTISLNFCAYMFFASGLGIYRIVQTDRHFFWVTCYFLICAGALFTLSRVPILLFIALNLVVAVWAGLIKNVERVVLMALFLVAIYFISNVLLADTLGKALSSFSSMLLTVFGGTKSSMAALDSNLGDSSDRMMLYTMVPKLVSGHEMFGLGSSAPFEYIQANGLPKQSCENLYLYRYYSTGFVGLLGTLLFWLSYLAIGIKRVGSRASWERGLSFSQIVPVVLIAYMLFGFDASFGDEFRIAFLFLGIASAYYWRFAKGSFWAGAVQNPSSDLLNTTTEALDA